MSRRFLLPTASAALALAVLSGCGGATTGTSNPSTAESMAPAEVTGDITVRVYPLVDEAKDSAFWQGQASAFQTKYPNATVKIDVQPWKDRETALTTAIAGGTAPDVAYMIPDELRLFQSKGALTPLKIDKTGIRESALSAATVDGELYGAPTLMTVVPGVCDKKAMEATGITKAPATWDEVLSMGEQAKAKGYYITDVLATNAATLNTSFYPFVWQAGGDVFDSSGKLTIDSPEAIDATTFLTTLVEKGYANKADATNGGANEQTSIGQRKVVCTWLQAPTTLAEVWGDDRVVVAPLTNKAMKTYGTVGSQVVLKGSKAPDVAQAWVSFVSSAEVVTAVDKYAGYYSPRTDTDLGFAAGSIEAETEKYLDATYSGAPVPYGRAVQAAIAPQVQAAVLGQSSPADAMKAAQSAGEPLAK